MKTDEAKTVVNSLDELNQSYVDLTKDVKRTTSEANSTKKLWRSKNNSTLIKIGLALIVFPDPTISDVVGTFLVAAGTVQQGIRHRTIYVEDVYKTFQNTLKDIRSTRETF